jgi:hypothetical protein
MDPARRRGEERGERGVHPGGGAAGDPGALPHTHEHDHGGADADPLEHPHVHPHHAGYAGGDFDGHPVGADAGDQSDALTAHSLTIARRYRDLARQHPDWSTARVLTHLASLYVQPASEPVPAGQPPERRPDAGAPVRAPSGRLPDEPDGAGRGADPRQHGGEPGQPGTADRGGVPDADAVPDYGSDDRHDHPRPFGHVHYHQHATPGISTYGAHGDYHTHGVARDHHPI